MSHTMGFGGTIPWRCTNCNNEGLIDFGRLEGYTQAFISIEKAEILIIDIYSKVEEVMGIYLSKKNKVIYVYFKSDKYNDKIMNKLINEEIFFEDTLKGNNVYEIHYIPTAIKLNESLGTDLKCLYKKELPNERSKKN